jgi:putative oxidoreductase
MRNITLFGARLVLGGYMAVHGAQKLFGAFGGHGLEKTAAGFESMGLTPGQQMATAVGWTELGGGLLTAAGIADPLGPLAIIGAMTVASAAHRDNGPLAARSGYELPLMNLAAAAALAVAGPGKMRMGPRLPKFLAIAAVLGGGAVAGTSLAKLLSAESADGAGDAAQPAEAGGRAEPGGTADQAEPAGVGSHRPGSD